MRILSSNPSLLRRRKHLFLFSHARGYTTLLSHIIGSHREISGYAETWLSYSTPLDLTKLRLFICHHGNYKPQSRYLFDKLLHDQLTVSPSILRREDVHCLFMVRKPEPTLKSMVALYRDYVRGGGSAIDCTLPPTVDAALHVYTNRLRTLAHLAEQLHQLGRNSIAFLADDLIENSQSLLGKLADFLQLSTPFHENYSLFARTGAWDRGDTSDFIRRRRIVRDRPKHEEIIVPPPVTEEATDEYERCLAKLRRWSYLTLHLLVVYVVDITNTVAVFAP